MTETKSVRLDGKVAIVTGAGRGLGRAHALLLAARGAKVVVNDNGASVTGDGESNGPAEDVAHEIREDGGEAVADTSSVATPDGGEALVNAALKGYGRVDILVNNAGNYTEALFEDMSPERFEPILDVHLRGAFHVTVPVWRVMKEQKYGRVVNVTSGAAWAGSPQAAHYASAKGAIIGLTHCLAIEGADHNIKVNAIAPAGKTRMVEKVDPTYGEAVVRTLGDARELMQPEKVSPVVVWLAHEDCDVTGQIFSVMMGRVSRVFLGLTPGYFSADLDPDAVRAHFGEILEQRGYSVPESFMDEMEDFMRVHGSTYQSKSGQPTAR